MTTTATPTPPARPTAIHARERRDIGHEFAADADVPGAALPSLPTHTLVEHSLNDLGQRRGQSRMNRPFGSSGPQAVSASVDEFPGGDLSPDQCRMLDELMAKRRRDGRGQVDALSPCLSPAGPAPDEAPPESVDADGVRSSSITEHLVSLLGPDVVLLPVPRGVKGPRSVGWPDTRIDAMSDPAHIERLNNGNIGVLTGAHSGDLCSIDIDDGDDIEPFVALNPGMDETLRSHGEDGCNFWIRMIGPYPPTTEIKKADDSHWGEFRGTGTCSMMHGLHPEGMDYTRSPEVPPIAMAFGDIAWPDGLKLSWMTGEEELPGTGDESDDPIILQYGQPVYFTTPKNGETFVNRINEAYWAALYAAENTVLYDPEEKVFYQYCDDTGSFSIISSEAIMQAISLRMLEMSRQDGSLGPLEKLRTERILSGVIAQLRGIVERRNPFAGPRDVVHLANCMLRFDGPCCYREVFSPEFYSRNRSPIVFDPAAQCPRFLDELVRPAVHPEDVFLLQKLAGQCLLGKNLIQRFAILDGESERGKTQFSNVIQLLIGRENISQLRTEQLGKRFEEFRFRNCTLLIGVDVPADFLSSKGAHVLKGLVGGDWFDAEQKGGTGSFRFQGTLNVLVNSNCRLKVKLQGDAGAWRRRILIVRYEAPPPRRKIPDFGALLMREEGPGILNWALQGLGMLMEDIEATGDIVLTPRQRGLTDALLAESDSLRIFLRTNVMRDDGSSLTSAEIREAYGNHCAERGWSPLLDSDQLPLLMRELFQVARSNDCIRNGTPCRGYHRVAFIREEGQP